MSVQACDPLKELLSEVLARLSVVEGKVGVTPPAPSTSRSPAELSASKSASVRALSIRSLKEDGDDPSVKAYDEFIKQDVVNFADACDELKGLEGTGGLLVDAFESVRSILVLASKSKKPEEDLATALSPFLQPTQEVVRQIRELKLDRDFDRQQKAITEAITCLSWMLMTAPKQLPIPFVKETLGSAEFWTNRIRKDFRGKDEKQIEFCDSLKKMMGGLEAYIEQYHKTGLTFNPKGLSFKETAIRMSDEGPDDDASAKTSSGKRRPTLGVTAAPNMLGLIGELAKKRNEDGSSAATGLKHVSKDMQTWRKEYKKEEAGSTAPESKPISTPKVAQKKKPLKGLPIFEYQDRGFKWVVENHTTESVLRESHENGVLTITVSDTKQQVYLYNCDGVTVRINGKFKSLALDQCTNCSVIYDDLISSTEVVNCKRIQLQVNGISPVFTIDKTMNIMVYLMSQEILELATFTTSLSSEMNVSFPDGDDQKELAIPEQFVHKLKAGRVVSEVSDLYH